MEEEIKIEHVQTLLQIALTRPLRRCLFEIKLRPVAGGGYEAVPDEPREVSIYERLYVLDRDCKK